MKPKEVSEMGTIRLPNEIDSQSLLRALFQYSRDGHILVNENDEIAAANEAASAILGIPQGSLVNKSIDELISPMGQGARPGRGGVLEPILRQTIRQPEGKERVVELTILRDVSPGFHLYSLRDVTAEVEQQRIIQTGEQRFRAYLDQSPALMFIKDSENKIIFGNRAILELWNKREDQVPGLTVFDLYSTELASLLTRADEEVLEKGAEVVIDDIEISRDGRKKWYRNHKFPFKDPVKGTLIGGYAVDITRQKLLELELRDQLEFIEGMSKTTPELLFVFDLQKGEIVYLNHFGEEMLGLSADAPEGAKYQDLLDLVHPDDRALLIEGQPLPFTNADDFVLEQQLRVRTKNDAGYRWLHTFNRVLNRDKDGNPRQIVGAGLDITKQKQAEEALQRTQFSIDQCSQAIFWVDLNHRMVYVNEATCNITGYPREQLLEMTVDQISHPWNELSLGELVGDWESVEGKAFENRLKAKDGSLVPVDVVLNGMPFQDETLVFVTATDISERIVSQDSLAYHRAFERLLESFSTRFISIPREAIEDEVRKALNEIRDFSGYDLGIIWPSQRADIGLQPAISWKTMETGKALEKLESTLIKILPDIEERARTLKSIQLDGGSEWWQESGQSQRLFARFGIEHFVAVPISQNEELLGLLCFVSLDGERTISSSERYLFLMAAQIFSNTFQRLRVASALQESEFRFRVISELSSDAAFSMEFLANGGIRMNWASDAMEQLTGWPIEGDIPHERWSQSIHPDDLPVVMNAIQNLTTEREAGAEFRLMQPDGSIKWLEVNAKKGEPDGSDVAGVQLVGAIRDITQTKLAIRALETSEEKFRQAFHTLPEGVTISRIDDLVLLDTNLGFTQLTGYAREEVLGKSGREIGLMVEESERLRFFKTLEEVGEVADFRTLVRRKDGEIRPFLFSARTIEMEGKLCALAVFRDRSDEEDRRKALRESEAQFRSIFEDSGIGMSISDSDGTILRVNRTLCDLLGWEPEEMVGKHWDDLIHEADLELQKSQLLKLVANQQHTFHMQLRYRHKLGIYVWVLLTLSVARSSSGGPLVLISQAQDITGRKETEEALAQRALQLTTLNEVGRQIVTILEPEVLLQKAAGLIHRKFSYQHVSAFMVDGDEIVLSAAVGLYEDRMQAGARLPLNEGVQGWVLANRNMIVLGRRGLELDGKRYYPDYDETRSMLLLPIILGNRAVGILEVQSQKDQAFGSNDFLVLETFASQLAVALSNAQLFTQLQAELDERQRTEVELRKLSLVVEQNPTSVMIADPNGVVEYVNHRFEGMTGYLREQVLGFSLEQVGRLTGNEPFYRTLRESVAGGQSWRGEYKNRRKDGNQIWESATLSPLREQHGKITHFVVLSEDISLQKEQDERLRQQEQLAAVGQMAAGIAHDFNNIIATIMLYSQLMQQDSAMSQRGLDRLETIVQQSRRASELIQQILDFSRQSVLERQSLHLIPILKELAKLLVRTLPENIIIKLTFEHIPHLISADATRIQQMMMNLCLNARDAMPDGGELTINVESIHCEEDAPPPLPEMTPGTYLHIRVEDTGEGMSDEVLSHIWEPFYSTKDRGKGTGLGLAQVYGIVKQHQGFVDVVSEIGSGSSFHIYLPTVEVAPAPVSEKSKDKTPGGQGELILVVEDNAPTRNALEESLEVLGYEVVTAHNGQAALELMATLGEDIALVLSDVVMPTMGGREMLHRMREAGNQTKVIMLTGHLLDTPLEDLRAEGMFAWVMKPPTLAKLAQVIHEALHSEEDRL